jgi:hypothetical protein
MRVAHARLVALALLFATTRASAQDVAPVDTATRIRKLVATLGDQDRDGTRVFERVLAAQSLGEIGAKTPEVKDALVARFEDESLDVRATAGLALVRLKLVSETGVVEALATVVEKARGSESTTALIALRELGPAAEGAVDAVRRRIEKPNPPSIACQTLVRLGPKGVEGIAALTTASQPVATRIEARSAAGEAVLDALDGKRDDLDALLAIVANGLRDADEGARLHAELTLTAIARLPELDDARRAKIEKKLARAEKKRR